MATIVNQRDVLLQATSPRLAGVLMAPNLELDPSQVTGLGLIIEGTKSLELNANSMIFNVDTAGVSAPTAITLSVVLKNITGTPTLSVLAGSLSSVPTFSGTTATLPYADVTSDQVTLRASLTDGSVTYTDDISLTKVFETTDGISGWLTNESHTVPGDSAGNVTNYAGAGGTFKVYHGAVDVTLSCTFAIASGGNPASLTTAINATTGVYSVTGGYPTGSDVATVTYEATYGSIVLQKVFSVTKARTGSDGVDGGDGLNGSRTAILDMYLWASAPPAIFPSGTSTYTWATGQFTAPATPNSWTLAPTTGSAGLNLYVARQIYVDSGTSATSNVTWAATSSFPISRAGDAGADGTNGYRTGFLEVYQWAATTPTSYPSGTSTYTWATGAFTAPSTPNGWSVTPGTAVAGHTLYGISTRVVDNLTTATSVATWSSTLPYPVGAAGTNGTNGAAGQRGSRTFYVTLSGSTATYSDALATSTASVSGGPVLNDTVTQSNNSVGFSQTKFWDGSNWLIVNAVVDGNLLVSGTVGATAIAAQTIEARHLKVNGGYGTSVWQDTNFADTTAWTIGSWGVFPTQGTTTTGVSGGTTLRSPTGGAASAFGTRKRAVTVGRTYRVSVRVRRDATSNGVLYLRLNGGTAEGGAYNEVGSGIEAVSPAAADTWTLYSYQWVATYPFVSPMVLVNYAGSVGYMEAQDIRIEEMIDSTLVVTGGIVADNIDTRNLTIKDSSGTVVFSAGVPLTSSYITPASTWLNTNVTISSSGVLSGAGGGTVTISGLDNTVVRSANPINAGNISTYIASAAITDAYIGSLNASKIVAGTITTDKIQVGAASSFTVRQNILASDAPASGAMSASVSAGGVGTNTFTTTGAPLTVLVDLSYYFNCYASTAIRYVRVFDMAVTLYNSGSTTPITSPAIGGEILIAHNKHGGSSSYWWASTSPRSAIAHYSSTATPGTPFAAGTYRVGVTASFEWYDANMNSVALTTGSGGNLIGVNATVVAMENKV